MSEDRLLRRLGQVAREEREAEQGRFDERWDRLAAGNLTAEEEAQLRALAEAAPEAREAFEAFRPLGADFQARVVEAVSAELANQAPEVESQESRSRLLPFRRTATRLGGWVAAAGTAAATLLLLLRSLTPLPPLPVYAAALSLGDQTFRGEAGKPTGLPVFGPGSQLTLIVSPQQPVTGPVEAHGFLARGAEIGPWEPEPRFEVADSGAVRLQGRLGQEIRLQPGNWRVWIVVGRPGKIPPTDELLSKLRAGRTRHEHWQAVHADLRVEDSRPP
jgi:hypothetical protein